MRDQYNRKEIDNVYRIDYAILLKTNPRALSRGKSEELLKQIVEEDIINYEMTLLALLNLCDLLITDLRNTGILEIIDELNIYIRKLINIAENQTIWQEVYEREEGDIFQIQDEISLKILNKLRINLLREAKEKIVKKYTDNIEAYNMYLMGRFFSGKRTKEGLQKAIEFYEKAIEEDPEYALSYAGIADCYFLLHAYGSLPQKVAAANAKKAALMSEFAFLYFRSKKEDYISYIYYGF